MVVGVGEMTASLVGEGADPGMVVDIARNVLEALGDRFDRVTIQLDGIDAARARKQGRKDVSPATAADDGHALGRAKLVADARHVVGRGGRPC